ncbi:hypothetical protein [Mesorhizobium sp. KR9-304]|uniref:hypothetical protein n=1 Tax=Mesorhizobium sp. KR9-304 TaxID=3156614 RepID=UPI0032B53594
MNFPNQAVPVARQSNKSRSASGGLTPSAGIECQLCHLACEAIGNPLAKQACHIACDQAVC